MHFYINGHRIETRYYAKPDAAMRKRINDIRKNFYVKDRDAMRANLRNVLLSGGTQISAIYAYFFEKLANDAKRYDSTATINQALENDACMAAFLNKIDEKSKFFDKNDQVSNVKQAFRLGSISRIVKKLANFPVKPAKALIDKYSLGGDSPLYLDTSCGWGARMLAAAASRHNYVGFEVNPKLVVELRRLAKEIQRILPDWKYRIIEHGSEYIHEPAVGTVDVMLTSPPYFCMEEYVGKNQSYTIGMSYAKWCSSYLKPMLKNSHEYLRTGGYCLVNIKDFKKYDLVAKTRKYGKRAGFKFVGYESLKLGFIPRESGIPLDMGEPILVFKKIAK